MFNSGKLFWHKYTMTLVSLITIHVLRNCKDRNEKIQSTNYVNYKRKGAGK